MKGYLIDPVARSVRQVDYDGNINTIHELIGADCFDIMRMKDGDGVFVDDEGLLKPFSPFDLFLIDGYYPLCGKGLVLGSDEHGESVSPHIKYNDLIELVKFFPQFNPMDY